MTRDTERGSEFFETWVMGVVRVLVVVVIGGGVGHTLALNLLERFWPGYPPSLLLLGPVVGILLMYLLYRALKGWGSLLSFISR